MSPKNENGERELKVKVKHKPASFCPPLKYKIISDQEVNLTKEKAFAFLELKQFDGERAVRERHVQFLFDEWAANRFLWQNIIVASAKVVGEEAEYRINGQHTCWMRVSVPERYEPLDCKVRVMCYSVQNEEQLRTLYSVFDRGAPRTQNHIGQVILMGSNAAAGIHKRHLGLLVSGFKLFWDPDARRVGMSINDWCGIIENNHSTLFNVAGRYFSGHMDSLAVMKRAAVIAAMFFTFEKNVAASDDFWGRVADGIGLNAKSDPRYQLRNYLLTHSHSAASGLEKVSQEDMLCVCLNLWNHWRAGDSVTVVKPVSERPKVKA